MEKDVCLRCGGHMKYMGREYLQRGKMRFLTGEWSNLLSGAYEVETYVCENCRKMEFYAAEGSDEAEKAEGGSIMRVPCPHCGAEHDLDDAVCPSCGARLQELDSMRDFLEY